MKRDSLFKGTFILSVSLILTKIIGLIYIIPYYKIVGGKNNMILINYAYNYYVLLLELSSAGIPLAISKLISKYNEEKNYNKSKMIAKIGAILLLVLGILGFIIFIFGAESLAEHTIATVNVPLRYSVKDLELVIQTLSLAVPFAMLSAGLRGIFQGHEIMLPSAISQFFEQFIRILFMMLGTYIVMNITSGNVVYANAIATFAASVGAIVAVLILFYYYLKYKKHLFYHDNDINEKQKSFENGSVLGILKEIFSVSIPFVIVSSFFALLSLIDQNTLLQAMDTIGKAQIGEDEFNIYNNYINKLVMISVAIAPAFTGAFLPAVTRLYVKRNNNELSTQINKVTLSLLMIVLPSLFGMYILTKPLYVSFYEYDLDGFRLMKIYLPLALVYAVYGLTSIIMQAIEKQKLNIYIIILGALFKYFLNKQFIYKFETAGAIYCSVFVYIIMIFLNVVIIHNEIHLKLLEFIKNFIKILVTCIVMSFVTFVIYEGLVLILDVSKKFDSLLIIIICLIPAVISYFSLLIKIKFTDYLFSRKVTLTTLLRRR